MESEEGLFTFGFKGVTPDAAGLEQLVHNTLKRGLECAVQVVQSIEVDAELEEFKAYIVERLQNVEIVAVVTPASQMPEVKED